MRNQITYLFGAGASANALPIVKNIPDELLRVSQLINNYHYSVEGIGPVLQGKPSTDPRSILVKDIESIMPFIQRHSSIDTYAKKLYLQGDKRELMRLKLILSIFFTILQLEGKKFEKRYDSFFASILRELDKFPKNIRILSWNYDQQFEISYAQYAKCKIDIAYQKLKIQSKHLGKSLHNEYAENEFSIIKLNGSTGLINNNKSLRNMVSDFNNLDFNQSLNPEENRGRDLIEHLVAKYYEIMRPLADNEQYFDYQSLMSFAWEKELFGTDHIMEKAIASAKGTSILVVIGYSFPFFNREIDKRIFDSMQGLKKIYIQDKYPDQIIARIKTLIPFHEKEEGYPEIVKYEDLEQFLLPDELELTD